MICQGLIVKINRSRGHLFPSDQAAVATAFKRKYSRTVLTLVKTTDRIGEKSLRKKNKFSSHGYQKYLIKLKRANLTPCNENVKGRVNPKSILDTR